MIRMWTRYYGSCGNRMEDKFGADLFAIGSRQSQRRAKVKKMDKFDRFLPPKKSRRPGKI